MAKGIKMVKSSRCPDLSLSEKQEPTDNKAFNPGDFERILDRPPEVLEEEIKRIRDEWER